MLVEITMHSRKMDDEIHIVRVVNQESGATYRNPNANKAMECLDMQVPIEEVAQQVAWYRHMFHSTGVVEQTHKHSSTIHQRFPRLGVAVLTCRSFISLANTIVEPDKDNTVDLIDAEICALKRKRPQRSRAANLFAKDLMTIALRETGAQGSTRNEVAMGTFEQSLNFFDALSNESKAVYEQAKEQHVAAQEKLIANKIRLLEAERSEYLGKVAAKRAEDRNKLRAANFKFTDEQLEQLNDMYRSGKYTDKEVLEIMQAISTHPVGHPSPHRRVELLRAASSIVEPIHVADTPEWARMICRRREFFARAAIAVTDVFHKTTFYLYVYARKDRRRVVLQPIQQIHIDPREGLVNAVLCNHTSLFITTHRPLPSISTLTHTRMAVSMLYPLY